MALDAPQDLLAAAALAVAGTATPDGPWRRAFEQGEVRIADGRVTVGDRTWEAHVHAATQTGRLTVELDAIARHYAVSIDREQAVWIARDGHQLQARARATRPFRCGPRGRLSRSADARHTPAGAGSRTERA